MAQRRMTSLEVIDTDAFLEMPLSSQLLYFHLNARADDDGFVAGPRKIAKSIGSNADDLKVLLAKKFVIEFEDGVCVIKHWRINNFIRKDIYKETQYLDLKNVLFIRANGAYTLSDGPDAIPVPHGHYKMEYVNDTLTKRQLRIGKDRILSEASLSQEKVYEDENTKKPRSTAKYPHSKEVFSWFPSREPSWDLNTTELKHAELLFLRGEKKVRSILAFCGKHKSDEFLPSWETPSQLERNWNKIIKFADRNGL